MNKADFIEISPGCFVLERLAESFKRIGLCGVDDFINFTGGQGINTKVLPGYRKRICFEAGSPPRKFYLKTYNNPPLKVQISNMLAHGRKLSTAAYDYMPAVELAAIGIKTPEVAAYGELMGAVFEKKSFAVTREIEGQSLERSVPKCFQKPFDRGALAEQRRFVDELAMLTGRFHNSGYRHRDYYLAHIFWSPEAGFRIIDLQRVFKPRIFAARYRIKDLAQLYYSSPMSVYSRAARLRFYLRYAGIHKLTPPHRRFIKRVIAKAEKMAAHDKKRGRPIPYKT